ncbi:MAG: hypothetical protein HW416_1784, partial [Chloroflexi bacterium]|nr:hypothetical protein [Chloroflexota bacterium]
MAYKTYLGGDDIRMIAGFSTNESSHVLIVRESIESPQQLEEVLLSGGYGASRRRFIDELNRILAANGVNMDDSRI